MSYSDQQNVHVVNMRVIGMMCQKNCGTTVHNALLSIPGVTEARATHATSFATVTVDMDKYIEEEGLTTGKDGEEQELQETKIKQKIEEDALDAVECVGFDATVLGPNDILEDIEKAKTMETAPPTSIIEDDFDEKIESSSIVTNSSGKATFQVGGMSCAVCTGRVERALLSVDGVVEASVSLPTSRARVVFEDFSQHILKEGGPEAVKKKVSMLAELCASEVQQGGYNCEIISAIALGLSDTEEDDDGGVTLADNAARMESARKEEMKFWRDLLATACIFTIPLVAIHFSTAKIEHDHNHGPAWFEWVSLILATPVQFGVGKKFYVSAYHSFVNGKVLGMDFLVAMGTTAAYAYSVTIFLLEEVRFEAGPGTGHLKPTFETGAMLLMFVTFGKFLEAYAKGKTASALQKLMELQPVIATRAIVPPDYLVQIEEDGDARGKKGDYVVSANTHINSLQTEDVDIKDVKIGDYLLVLPGARIPTDGVLAANEGQGKGSYVDEAALSGEPFPVAKALGDTLYGSTINQLSVILMRVTATGSGTVLARIVRLIDEAQGNRAPIQAQADRIASVFAPIVLMLSAITFILWVALDPEEEFKQKIYTAIMSAISVIVVACPCALGLATPTAVMVGTGVGATNGLLIKGGAVLEAAHGVDVVVFDKTGTITTGRAVLGSRYELLQEDDDLAVGLPSGLRRSDVALWLASCAELQSEHPLGRAIVNAGRGIWGGDVSFAKDGVVVSDCVVVPGSGVECCVAKEGLGGYGSVRVRVGNRQFVNDLREETNNNNTKTELSPSSSEACIGDKEVLKLRERGQVGVYVSICLGNKSSADERDWRVIGVLGIVDPVGLEAISTIAALHKMGVDVWMCTGDHETTAFAVADEVGINRRNVCAGVKPEGKADLVTRLQKQYRENENDPSTTRSVRRKRLRLRREQKGGGVAVVGDGINDAVALARSDVGIAIGAGTEVAAEAADIVLVKSSLHDVVVALHLSRVVFNRIRLNFVWAMGYNLFALPFAAGAFYPWFDWRLPPAFAGLMMAFSSVSVVSSSLLLRTYSKPEIEEDGTLIQTNCFTTITKCLSGIFLKCCRRSVASSDHRFNAVHGRDNSDFEHMELT
uniref:HMA domain-containing protein n=2 Tax=Ditylum brightwellii TaxID=49249 RepID=A0A7S4RJM8_9STRA